MRAGKGAQGLGKKKLPGTPKKVSTSSKKVSSKKASSGWKNPDEEFASSDEGIGSAMSAALDEVPIDVLGALAESSASASSKSSSASASSPSPVKKRSAPKKKTTKKRPVPKKKLSGIIEIPAKAPYFVRPKERRRKGKAKTKARKFVEVGTDEEGKAIYADIGEEQLIARWLAASTEERKKMIIGETEDGEPIYGDALELDDEVGAEEARDEPIDRRRARMLEKLRKILPYEENLEFEYGDVDLYTEGGAELARQLGLPLKENKLLPRKVRRYVVDAELRHGEDVFRMKKGPLGILLPVREGAYKIKRLGSDFEPDEEEIGVLIMEDKRLVPVKNKTAYKHFADDRRAELAAENPTMAAAEISAILRDEWKGFDVKEKAVFIRRAEKDEQRYKKEKKAYEASATKKYRAPKKSTPEESDSPAARRKGLRAKTRNPFNKKFSLYTRVSFKARDGKRVTGFVSNFAKPGVTVKSKDGKEHKISYGNPTLKILAKTGAPKGVYREAAAAAIQISDLYAGFVDPNEKKGIREAVRDIYEEVLRELMPALSVRDAKQQAKRYEEKVYNKLHQSSTKGKFGTTVYSYLLRALMPLIFLDGELSNHAKVFRAKIANGSYDLEMLVDANLAIFLPEFAMSSAFATDQKIGKHGTALDIAGEVISDVLHHRMDDFLERYLRMQDPTRQTRTTQPPNISRIIEPLVKLLEDPAEVCQRQTKTGRRHKVDAQGRKMYETRGKGKNKYRVPVEENIPAGELVMCYDERTNKFSCSGVTDVIAAIRLAERLSEEGQNLIYPVNPTTGEIYPDNFIERFKEMYGDQIAAYITPREPSPRPFTPSPVKEVKSTETKRTVKLPPRYKRTESPSTRPVKEITTMGLVGNHLDIISLFTDIIDVPLAGGDILQIPVSYDLVKNKDINVIVFSFASAGGDQEVVNLKKSIERSHRETMHPKADIYVIGVGDIGESKKKSLKKELNAMLVGKSKPKHIFFSEDDEEHLLDALINVVVDVEGVDAATGGVQEKKVTTKKGAKTNVYDPSKVVEGFVPFWDGKVWVYSAEQEAKLEKARKTRRAKITLKAGVKMTGKRPSGSKKGKKGKIVKKASPAY